MERSKISAEESIRSQKGQKFDYFQKQNEKQEFFQGSDEQIDFKNQPKLSTTHLLNQKNDTISQELPNNAKNPHERSLFHNFQKHLVITLRQFIQIKNSIHKNQPQRVACQLWQNFVKQSKIYTKNILQFVFGVVDYQSTQLTNVYDEQIVQRFGYTEIFSHYSDALLSQAQNFLRKQVVRQLKQSDLGQVMKRRRISSTQQFLKYVTEFISELQQGPIRKRLPKTKKMQMGLIKKIQKQENC